MKKVAVFGDNRQYECPIVEFDDSNNIVGLDILKACSTRIEYMYFVPEDMKVSYIVNGKSEYINVHKNDIIITFYPLPDKVSKDSEEVKKFKRVIVVSSDDWKNNIKAFEFCDKFRKSCCDGESHSTY